MKEEQVNTESKKQVIDHRRKGLTEAMGLGDWKQGQLRENLVPILKVKLCEHLTEHPYMMEVFNLKDSVVSGEFSKALANQDCGEIKSGTMPKSFVYKVLWDSIEELNRVKPGFGVLALAGADKLEDLLTHMIVHACIPVTIGVIKTPEEFANFVMEKL